jgi:hypothetical protein
VSPSDAETLDLTRGSSTDQFILSPTPRDSAFTPLWGLRLAVVKGLEAPIVLDPSCVTLYMGAAVFASDPFTSFSTNEVRLRFEGPACCVVRQPAGVYVVASS